MKHFNCEVTMIVEPLAKDQDLIIAVSLPDAVTIRINSARIFNVLAMEQPILAGVSQKLGLLIQQYLETQAAKEDLLSTATKGRKVRRDANEASGEHY